MSRSSYGDRHYRIVVIKYLKIYPASTRRWLGVRTHISNQVKSTLTRADLDGWRVLRDGHCRHRPLEEVDLTLSVNGRANQLSALSAGSGLLLDEMFSSSVMGLNCTEVTARSHFINRCSVSDVN